jgi:hypothetical protein
MSSINIKSETKKMLMVTVTPELANLWLRNLHPNQTKVKPDMVARFSRTILAGQWQDYLGSPIAFDTDGRNQNGQHRLLSVVATGVSIKCYILLGCTEENMKWWDADNHQRNTADVMSQFGVKHPDCMAGAVNNYWRFKMGKYSSRKEYPTPPDALRFLMEHSNIQMSYPYAAACTSFLYNSAGVFLHYLFAEIDREAANQFFISLADGANLGSQSPILLLRNKLIRNRQMKQVKLDRVAVAAMVILAWNAWRQNKKLSYLRWRAESFPEPI